MTASFLKIAMRKQAALWVGVFVGFSAAELQATGLATTGEQSPEDRLQAGPLCFVPQPGNAVFVARGAAYEIAVAAANFRLALRESGVDSATGASSNLRLIQLELAGADQTARIEGTQVLAGKMNFLLGSNPSKWRTGVPTYSRIGVSNVYPGIDAVYYGSQGRLEYDFVVAPGKRPSSIRLRIRGVDSVAVNGQGQLVLSVGKREVVQPKPLIYQIIGGRREVEGGYELLDSHTVGFKLGPYDSSRPLVIDPVLSYSAFFGGSQADIGSAIRVDSQGFVYIAGQTISPSFPFPTNTNAFEPVFQGGTRNGDAFVAKFDSSMTNLVYFTYLGGSVDDGAYDMAVDDAGHAYVTGFTDSPDFPVYPLEGVPGVHNRIGGSVDPNVNVYPTDAFVTELSSDGSSLVYSTYLGGDGADVAGGIAVDGAGSAYVTGNTYSTDFPVLNPILFQIEGTTRSRLDSLAGSNDVFVTRIAPVGAGLVFSTYFGGGRNDEGGGVAVDPDGFAVVTGYTSSTNFPLTPDAFQKLPNLLPDYVQEYRKRPGPTDAFMARIAPTGTSLAYSTLFGGSVNDAGFRVATDNQRNVYITGSTFSVDLTNTAGAFLKNGRDNKTSNSDVFLTKFSSGGELRYSAVYGSENNDAGWDVAVQPGTENAFVIGIAGSTNFSTFNSQGFPNPKNVSRATDLFVSAFNPVGDSLLYSVLLGGSQDDYGYSITVDLGGNVYVAGRTVSADFPVTSSVSGFHGESDAFLAKISLEPSLQATSWKGAVVIRWPGFATEYVLETTSSDGDESSWSPSPAPPTFLNGYHSVTLQATNLGTLFRLRRQ
jgi:hypothetical protein